MNWFDVIQWHTRCLRFDNLKMQNSDDAQTVGNPDNFLSNRSSIRSQKISAYVILKSQKMGFYCIWRVKKVTKIFCVFTSFLSHFFTIFKLHFLFLFTFKIKGTNIFGLMVIFQFALGPLFFRWIWGRPRQSCLPLSIRPGEGTGDPKLSKKPFGHPRR